MSYDLRGDDSAYSKDMMTDRLDQEVARVEEELGDALTRQGLLNDRCDEIAGRLQAARGVGHASAAAELAAQLDVAEARRARAMALACDASQRLNRLRARLRDG